MSNSEEKNDDSKDKTDDIEDKNKTEKLLLALKTACGEEERDILTRLGIKTRLLPGGVLEVNMDSDSDPGLYSAGSEDEAGHDMNVQEAAIQITCQDATTDDVLIISVGEHAK